MIDNIQNIGHSNRPGKFFHGVWHDCAKSRHSHPLTNRSY